MIKLIFQKNLCWTWRTSPVPCWYRGVWSKSWVNYNPLRPLETIWEPLQQWSNFYLNECMFIVSYDPDDIQKQDKTRVRDQINTVSKTNKHRTRWRKFTDENACLCTQKSRSNLIEGIQYGEIWGGMLIYYLFVSPNFSKAGRRLFVRTH